MDNELTTANQASIEKITNVSDAAKLNGVAKAAVEFYKAQEDMVAAQRAKEIYFRSARQAGFLLLSTPRDNGGPNSLHVKRVTKYQETLDGAGISPFISWTWQKLAIIKDGLFEQYLSEAKFEHTEYTINGLLRYANSTHIQRKVCKFDPCGLRQ